MNKLNNEVDSPEMIQYCLECPWKKCWDCLGQKNDYAYALRLELDERARDKLAKKIIKGAETCTKN